MQTVERQDPGTAAMQQRAQMLKLVTRAFYRELVNYGIRTEEIVRVASHLLDNLMADEVRADGVSSYNETFTLDDVEDALAESGRITVQDVSLHPFDGVLVPEVAAWLEAPATRESFVPPFPSGEIDLDAYFASPTRDYFAIHYGAEAVGIIGAENIDAAGGKLEMKKLVGRAGLRGKGIGKRATFAFLYHAFMVRGVNKVYVHSTDVNIRNILLNSRFGFELEGVLFEDLRVRDRWLDVVRMGLLKRVWLQTFAAPAAVSPRDAASMEWWDRQ